MLAEEVIAFMLFSRSLFVMAVSAGIQNPLSVRAPAKASFFDKWQKSEAKKHSPKLGLWPSSNSICSHGRFDSHPCSLKPYLAVHGQITAMHLSFRLRLKGWLVLRSGNQMILPLLVCAKTLYVVSICYC